jgi:hypothetical protein
VFRIETALIVEWGNRHTGVADASITMPTFIAGMRRNGSYIEIKKLGGKK